MQNPLVEDLAVVGRVAELAAWARSALEEAEPALARLEELEVPSAAMLRFDLGETIGRLEEVGESILALRFGLEIAPLEQEGLGA